MAQQNTQSFGHTTHFFESCPKSFVLCFGNVDIKPCSCHPVPVPRPIATKEEENGFYGEMFCSSYGVEPNEK